MSCQRFWLCFLFLFLSGSSLLLAQLRPHPLRMNDLNIMEAKPGPIRGIIFNTVGPVRRFVVTNYVNGVRLIRGNAPLYDCLIYFDGSPGPGTVVTFPAFFAGDHCRPSVWQITINTFGEGSAMNAGSVYFCTDGVMSLSPCCTLLPQGCESDPVSLDFEVDTDRRGSDYRNFFVEVPDPPACRLACLEDERCRAWTYVKPGVQGALARCWLKDKVPPARKNNCCVSGLKKTEESDPMSIPRSGKWSGTYHRGDTGQSGPFTLTLDREGGKWVSTFLGQRAKETSVLGELVTLILEPASNCRSATLSFTFRNGRPISGEYTAYGPGAGCPRTGTYTFP